MVKKIYLMDGEIVPPKGSTLRRVSVYSRIHAYSPKQAAFLLLLLHKSPEGCHFIGSITFQAVSYGTAKKSKPRPYYSKGQYENQVSMF